MTDKPTRAERAIARRRRELAEAELRHNIAAAKRQLRDAIAKDDAASAFDEAERWLALTTDDDQHAPNEGETTDAEAE